MLMSVCTSNMSCRTSKWSIHVEIQYQYTRILQLYNQYRKKLYARPTCPVARPSGPNLQIYSTSQHDFFTCTISTGKKLNYWHARPTCPVTRPSGPYLQKHSTTTQGLNTCTISDGKTLFCRHAHPTGPVTRPSGPYLQKKVLV